MISRAGLRSTSFARWSPNWPDLLVVALSWVLVVAAPGDLDGYDAQLIVCNEATDAVKSLAPFWVELTYPRAIEATVFLGGRRSRIENVGVAEMLAVMDEAERTSADP